MSDEQDYQDYLDQQEYQRYAAQQKTAAPKVKSPEDYLLDRGIEEAKAADAYASEHPIKAAVQMLGNAIFGSSPRSAFINPSTEQVKNILSDSSAPDALKADIANRMPSKKLYEASGPALEMAGALAVPELLPARAVGAGLLGRLGGYLANAGASAGGAYVGRQGAQELGMQPELTNEEELNRTGLDAALGFGIPAVFDVGKSGLVKALGFLNEPKTTARILGATSSDFNPMKEAVTIDQNISSLTKATPVELASAGGASVKPFAEILQESDPTKLKDLSTERLKAVGQEIRDIYSRNKGLSIDKSALLEEPSIKKYLDMLDSPDVSKGQKRIVKRSINELQSVLDNYDGKIPLNTLWGQAKAFGGDIPAQFSSDLNDQVTNSIRKGLKSAIDKTLTTGKSPDLTNLKSLNREFFDLLPVTETIAKKYSQEAGQIPFIPTSPSLGGIIKGLMQAPVGPARAFAYGANKSPGSPISPQTLIAALQAYPELTSDE